MTSHKTTAAFISEVEQIHGDKYDYSKVDYKNNHTKVCVVCKKHGDFFIAPHHLLEGSGCKECFKEKQSKDKTNSTEQFVLEAKKVHGDKYDYSSTIYRGYRYSVNIICPEHGIFTQNAGDHLKGCGCQECGKIIMWDNRGRLSSDDFIEKARKLHGDKYDYGQVKYVNAKTPIVITCRKHGEFLQTPSNHLVGCGCPHCSKSKMVNDIAQNLRERNIKYCLEKSFDWLEIKGNKLRIDIFLPDYNIGIECQGLQHFEPIEYWGGDEEFEKRKTYDEVKLNLCTNNGVKVLYYTNLKKFVQNGLIYGNINDLLKFLKDV